jgi:predicted flap endonuclease-1-like 5' DNA nuclease/predicted nuclease with TOPRIM domain
MTNFWCNFLPIFIGIGSALLGGLIGWYLHRQKTQELMDEHEELLSNNTRLVHAHDTLNIRCENLQSSFASLNETNKKLDATHADLQASFSQLNAEKAAFMFQNVGNNASNNSETETELADLLAHYATRTHENEDLNIQIAHLNSQLAAVNAEYFAYKNEATQPIAIVGDSAEQLKNLRQQYDTMLDNYIQQGQRIKNLTAEVDEWQGHFDGLMLKNNHQDTRIIELEEMRSSLDIEVGILRGRFNEIQERNTILEHELSATHQKHAALSVEKAHIDSTLADMNASFQSKTNNWELRYNELEARHSSLTRRFQDLNAANDTLEHTISGLNAEILAYHRRANPDDLKIIEGVGPKIEELLNAAGIYTYVQLATTEVATLRTILDNAGARFRMHDPQTWPIQADIADKGDWVKLKEYQEYLQAGRNPEPTLAVAAAR